MSKHMDQAVAAARGARPDYTQTRIKITGYLDPATGVVGNDPTAGAKAGYLWVRSYPRGANVQVIAGTRINPRIPNVQVKVGQNWANQAVAYDVVVDDNAVQQFGAALPMIATNPAPIDVATQETPLSLLGGGRVLPINTPSPGLNVFVEALAQVGWTGGNLTISSGDLPASANEFCFAVFYWPQGTSTPIYAVTPSVSRPDVDAFVTGNEGDIRALALPNGAIRGGAVTLANGQIDITAITSVFVNDLRDFLTPITPKNNYSASAAPTVSDDNTEGYSIGSVWIHGTDIYDCTDATTVAAVWTLRSGSSGGGGLDYICIQDQKAAGTDGGNFASGAWRTRDLNTVISNEGSHASLGSNQITLAAGTYPCLISAPGVYCGGHKTRLRDVTNGVTLLVGSNEYSEDNTTNASGCRSVIAGKFTLSGSTVIEVQHQCQVTYSLGFGVALSFGEVEVYTIAEFWKE